MQPRLTLMNANACVDDQLFKVDFEKIIPDTHHLFLWTSEILVENL